MRETWEPPRPLAEWPAARAWLDGTLAEHGLAPDGPARVLKVRPWSMVACVPVRSMAAGGASTVWFKANGRGSRYEPALLATLARWVPQWTIAPIAVQPTRGWSLLPDGGPSLRDLGRVDLADWERLLTTMAELQASVVDRMDALAAAGVPSLPASGLPEQLDTLLANRRLWTDAPADLRETVQPARAWFARVCAELAAGAVPDSLQHHDLHPGNVLADGRFFDWGDAYVGHPFGVLGVTLSLARRAFSLAEGDVALHRLRDAYLQPWTSYAPLSGLRREAALAMTTAHLARALSWQRALLDASPEQLHSWRGGVAGSLASLVGRDDLNPFA